MSKKEEGSTKKTSENSGQQDRPFSLAVALEDGGTVRRTRDNMVEYVADDLLEKIRSSSPSAKGSNSSGWSSRRDSASSGWSSPTSCGPAEAPPLVDVRAVAEVEAQARAVADNLHLTMGNVQGLIARMSALSTANLEVYGEAVNGTCDAVDSSIKTMYTVMARCEELNSAMEPVYTMHSQVREIKRLLDVFEKQLASSDNP